MRNKNNVALLLGVVLWALFSVPTVQSQAAKSNLHRNQNRIPSQYIVVLKGNIKDHDLDKTVVQLNTAYSGELGFIYRYAIKGFSARMSEQAAIALSNNPSVDYVEEDGIVRASTTQSNPPSWGLDRINQHNLPLDGTYTYDNTGNGVNVYVIDSGIRMTHTDFGGRASVGFDAVNDGQNGNDCFGHGTHVSGIIGGNNYGVAKGVHLYAVRVFDCGGNGSLSGVTSAVDWVTGHKILPAVANMSLIAGPSDSLDSAVRNSIASGVTYAVAAGNGNGADASGYSPARVTEAITVGATDISDTVAFFSNIGSVLDVFAPGDSITSDWYTSDTATQVESGTSMATPHVAGVAALYLQSNPSATPSAISAAITTNATPGVVGNPGSGSPNRLLFSVVPSVSMEWIKPSALSWGPSDTQTAAGFASKGTGNVALSWRDTTLNGPWNAVAYQAPIDPSNNSWSNTISSAHNCHVFQAKAQYSGVTVNKDSDGVSLGYCSFRVIWIQPQSTAGFGPPGSLVVAGSAKGGPSGALVTLWFRDNTAQSAWTQVSYQAPTDSNGIWYNAIQNADYTHQYTVYIIYDDRNSSSCTYFGNGSATTCP